VRQQVTILAIALAVPVLAHAQTPADQQSQLTATRAAQVESAATDPSLRSPIATPKIELNAEISDDQKTATAKAGVSWRSGWTGEAGVTGVFDTDQHRTALTSLRELTAGSSAWFATTWKKYRVRFDATQQEIVCRQAAWAAGIRFQEYDCTESALPDESFAARLRHLETPGSSTRVLCQQFERAMLTGREVAAGADLSAKCDSMDTRAAEQLYGARFTESYEARYQAAIGATPPEKAVALDLCNEYRRARGLPPGGECDPGQFSPEDKKNFARSWKERFASFRGEGEEEAAICDEYRQASGEIPTGRPGCTPSAPDPLFEQSFKRRYRNTYGWLSTPILSARVDASRPAFNYRDAVLQAHRDVHAIYSITGTAGVLLVTDTLLAFNYRRGRSWIPSDTIELCEPITASSALACRADVILGAPERDRRNQFEGQITGYLTRDIGAGIFVTRDTGKKAWGIELPVYFMKDKAGGLTGGLVFNYRSDDKAYDVSVFIGHVFSVFD
jgi:hypothetical protein